jgi:prolyl-tRNA editing enzyme YbaK/EbsC (Cys-tRNA(Pro) deacylase)
LTPAKAPSALKIQALIGPEFRVLEFDATTRTSADAASAIGCEIEQIAKSLIFRGRETSRSILVIVSGANRVDEAKVAALIGEKIARADADFVREKTGFSIGGVPPVGHAEAPLVLIDEDIFRLSTIWAAAGTPNAVFQLTPSQLIELTAGRAAAIAR